VRARRDFRVVGLQPKNTAVSTLADVMLPLHRGTQLLTNTQRAALHFGTSSRALWAEAGRAARTGLTSSTSQPSTPNWRRTGFGYPLLHTPCTAISTTN
jgi:hypothetical protein